MDGTHHEFRPVFHASVANSLKMALGACTECIKHTTCATVHQAVIYRLCTNGNFMSKSVLYEACTNV